MVAHRRDIGLSSIRQLSETHAILAAFSEQVQRSVHQSRPRPQTGLATLVHPRRFHATYSSRRLKTGQHARAVVAPADARLMIETSRTVVRRRVGLLASVAGLDGCSGISNMASRRVFRGPPGFEYCPIKSIGSLPFRLESPPSSLACGQERLGVARAARHRPGNGSSRDPSTWTPPAAASSSVE